VSYKNLEIWQLARELVVDIHRLTIQQLPAFEKYEEAAQIRRSIKSVKSCIVEGYGRRAYKNDFIKFITYAISSNDETLDHLETLFETGSLKDQRLYNDLHRRLEILGKKLNLFLRAIRKKHISTSD